MLTVQYPENTVKTLSDLEAIPLRGRARTIRRGSIRSPTSGTIRAHRGRSLPTCGASIDVYIAPQGEETRRCRRGVSNTSWPRLKKPEDVRISVRGSVQAMSASFSSFGLGLLLSVLLVYLVLVAQFRSFIDPFLILLAVPPGIMGVLIILVAHGNDPQRHVAHGHRHDGRHRGLEQHPHRGIHPSPDRGRACRCVRPWPRPAACVCGRF